MLLKSELLLPKFPSVSGASAQHWLGVVGGVSVRGRGCPVPDTANPSCPQAQGCSLWLVWKCLFSVLLLADEFQLLVRKNEKVKIHQALHVPAPVPHSGVTAWVSTKHKGIISFCLHRRQECHTHSLEKQGGKHVIKIQRAYQE